VALRGRLTSDESVWAILVVALALRVLAALPATAHPERFWTDDSHEYVAVADDLRGAYLDPRAPAFVTGLLRTPVYPVFLAALRRLCGGTVLGVVAGQIGVSLVTIALAVALGRRVVGRRAALAGGLLLAVDPASALFVCLLQPETLFTALLVGAVLLWTSALGRSSAARAAGAGVLLGVAALTRPIGVFVPFCLAPVVWTRPRPSRPMRLAVSLLLAAAAPLGVWTAKNWVLTGAPVYCIAGDSSLLHYRAAGALAEDEHIPLDQARARVWQRVWAMSPPAVGLAELSARERRVALQVLAEHPAGAMKMAFNGVVRMMAGTGVTAFSNLLGDPGPEDVAPPWKRALQTASLAMLVVGYLAVGRGLIRLAIGGHWRGIALLAGPVLYLALSSAGPEANTRFRFPAAPFLALLAGYGLAGVVVSPPDDTGGCEDSGRTTTVASR
jgi:4-amino-4-deoxy-L-arabinose transferase-like glycosyltransferase